MPPHRDPEDAGAAGKRQARPALLLLAALLIGVAGGGGDCRAEDGQPPIPTEESVAGHSPSQYHGQSPGFDLSEPAAPAPVPLVTGRQLQLLDAQRRVQGRLQSLDRELAPYERDRMRSWPPGTPGVPPGARVPGRQTDPLAGRLELERRDLQFRQRQIESDLRTSGSGR